MITLQEKKPLAPRRALGVAWFGEIPQHWRCEHLKRFTKRIQAGMTPPTNTPEYYCDGTIPWFAPGCFNGDIDLREPRKLINELARSEGELRIFPSETVFLVGIGATIGKVGLVSAEASCNQQLIGIVCDYRMHSRFLAYQFKIYEDVIPGIATATTLPIFDQVKTGYLPMLQPPFEEQQRIVAYLDASCAAIDAAVAAKRRQRETLDALHKSITLQAVTKGLYPNVPMRETGIDWIPQIPAHWETTKLTSLFWFRKGARAGEITQKYIAEYPGEFPVFSGQTEDGGLMGSIDSFEFDFDSPVIFVTTVGAKAMSTRLVKGKFSVSQNCALIIPWHRKTHVDYFEPTIQELFDFERRSIALIMQPSLRFKDLKKFRLPLPPPTEQAAICAHLCAKLGEARRIASGIESQIAILIAYRKSLIHECVTGQRRITEADVARSQLSAKTGQLNREPSEKIGRFKTPGGDDRTCSADLGKALKGGGQFVSPLAFKFATEGGD